MAALGNSITFNDFSGEVTQKIENAILEWLEESGSELESETITRTRRSTGETAKSWTHVVDRTSYEAIIGNPLENAIWEEFGTGEYALNDNGRRGGWVYRDERTGKYYHTYGKTPNRALHHAFTSNEEALKDYLRERLRSMR